MCFLGSLFQEYIGNLNFFLIKWENAKLTVHLKKAVAPTYHVLKTIIMLLPDSMGYINRAPILNMPQNSS